MEVFGGFGILRWEQGSRRQLERVGPTGCAKVGFLLGQVSNSQRHHDKSYRARQPGVNAALAPGRRRRERLCAGAGMGGLSIEWRKSIFLPSSPQEIFFTLRQLKTNGATKQQTDPRGDVAPGRGKGMAKCTTPLCPKLIRMWIIFYSEWMCVWSTPTSSSYI